ncbi:MAG: hypothetical protein WBC07_11995 [Methylotenera sp.]
MNRRALLRGSIALAGLTMFGGVQAAIKPKKTMSTAYITHASCLKHNMGASKVGWVSVA